MRRFDMYVPEDSADLLQYLDQHQNGAHLIANGSDLINRIQRRQVNPNVLVDLSALSEYKYVRKEDNTIRIGALTTISDLITSPIIDSRLEAFREVAKKFGGPQIINVATIGGNICAASSSEDLLPVLLVLDAQVRLKSLHEERVLRLEDFVIGKRMLNLKPNELLVEVIFQAPDNNSACAFEKVGMRNSLIIAFVSSAVFMKLDLRTRLVHEVRIAFNRAAGKIPGRATHSEQVLQGKEITKHTIQESLSFLTNELRLSSDFRVSSEYRLDVAKVLFKRALNRCMERLTGEKITV